MTQLVLVVSEWLNVSSVIDSLKSIYVRFEKHRQYRKTLKELELLSDRELNDIGITRGDIYHIAMEVYYDNR